MSVLTVLLVREGILFAADRNITATEEETDGNVTIYRSGQTRRPKVLKWPNHDVLIGYVGLAEIGGTPTDQWLYSFIGRHLEFGSLRQVAEALTADLQTEVPDEVKRIAPLVVHIGGFDKVNGERAPVIWFIHNTSGLTETGDYVPTLGFSCSEELRADQPGRFGGMTQQAIRERLGELGDAWEPFWFRQGFDLATLNILDQVVRLGMRVLVEHHPLRRRRRPDSLGEWEKHLRLLVLTYGAYFSAFYAPYRQYVGGGVDVLSVAWPPEEASED